MRPFHMNAGHARARLVQAGSVVAAVALVAGCGNNYRPVVTPTNPSGPAAQPQSFVVVVTAPSPTSPGITTVIDYAGDSIRESSCWPSERGPRFRSRRGWLGAGPAGPPSPAGSAPASGPARFQGPAARGGGDAARVVPARAGGA